MRIIPIWPFDLARSGHRCSKSAFYCCSLCPVHFIMDNRFSIPWTFVWHNSNFLLCAANVNYVCRVAFLTRTPLLLRLDMWGCLLQAVVNINGQGHSIPLRPHATIKRAYLIIFKCTIASNGHAIYHHMLLCHLLSWCLFYQTEFCFGVYGIRRFMNEDIFVKYVTICCLSNGLWI